MDDLDDALNPPDLSDRRNLAFVTAKSLAVLGHHFLAKAHTEFDEDLVRIRRQPDAVFFYAGLHKSLWETSALLVPLAKAALPLPFVGMGDNLVHGRLFRSLSRSVGVFWVRRPSSRREVFESARKLRADMLGLMAHGFDVLLFPEGTRKNVPTRGVYGDFYSAAFEPLLEYERTKDRICAAHPDVRPRKVYIVPVNVDYSRVREATEIVDQAAGRPQTLHVFDSFSMIRNIGDTYLSYGKPMPVAEHLHLDRKQLAAESRERCMQLVKILPVNVACHAMLRLDPTEPFSTERLSRAVRDVVAALAPYADRFRGFTASDAPLAIVRAARRSRLAFERFDARQVPLLRLYADYVRHYLPASSAEQRGQRAVVESTVGVESA